MGYNTVLEKISIDVSRRNWHPSPLAGPIALVTTVDSDRHANIAPKSLINFATVRPLRIVLGCTREHHTAQNLLENGECVLNFPSDDLVDRVWAAAEFREPADGEVTARGFTEIPAECVVPPRILECRYHVECRSESVHWFGDECVFYFGVLAASVDQAAYTAEDPYSVLRPVFFLEPSTYGTITSSKRLR